MITTNSMTDHQIDTFGFRVNLQAQNDQLTC